MDKYFSVVNIDEQLYVEFNHFVSFLRKNHLPNDKKTEVLAYRTARLLKSYRGGIKVINDNKYIPIQSVFHYIFHNVEELNICDKISQTILSLLYESKSSILDLYSDIASNDTLLTSFLSDVPSEFEIGPVYTQYKDCFKDHDWDKSNYLSGISQGITK